MTEQKKEKHSCDDIGLLISRNLDGDLCRPEILQLYEHLASCSHCRIQMSQISALEDSMEDLKALYRERTRSPLLARSVRETISRNKRYGSDVTPSGRKPRLRIFFSPRIKPAFGVLGAVVVLSLSLLLWWRGAVERIPPQQRFVVHEIPLRSAEDRIHWNHRYTIPPSQIIRLKVRKSNPDPYFFQVSSPKPGGFSVTHNQEIQRFENLRQFHLDGIQYIILKKPRLQDTVHIYNRGTYPILLKTSSQNPRAIQANFE